MKAKQQPKQVKQPKRKVHGLLVVDKPAGLTSHDVVARARRLQRTREIGHTGTLDPFATGVMVLALGEGLKLAAHLTDLDKEYEAEVQLGAETDSLDHTGAVVERAPVPPLGTLDAPAPALLAALAAERARTEQIPPAASAIHVDGERAHARLRRGEVFELPPRPVAVRELQLLAIDGDRLRLRVHAAKGYYVRSLARDLARSLGTYGHLSALRRLRSGAFRLADCRPLEGDVMALPEALHRLFPCVTLRCSELVRELRQGKRPHLSRLDAPAPDGLFVGMGEDDWPIALLRAEGEQLVVQRGFVALATESVATESVATESVATESVAGPIGSRAS